MTKRTIVLLALGLASSTTAFSQHRLSFGLLRANFERATVHFEQDRYERDITYREVEGRDDLRLRLLDGYHITQLQFYFRYGYHFSPDQFVAFQISY